MRKVILSCLLLIFFAVRQSHGQDTAIFFGNGIRTVYDDAKRSAYFLEAAYRAHKGLSRQDFRLLYDVQLAYNQSGCPAGCASDLYEAFTQWARANNLSEPEKLFWQIVGGLGPAIPIDWNAVGLAQAIGGALPEGAVTADDLSDHIDIYKQALYDGRKVLIVAHSQGNYFANAAYNSPLLSNADRESLGIVAVASPASTVAGDGDHLTLKEDPIHFVPGSLPANVTNGALVPSVESHSFDSSYLPGVESGPRLMALMDSALTFLRKPAPDGPVVRPLVQNEPGQPGKDIWTTNIYSYAPGGLEPGGGLDNDELVVGGWGDLYYSLLQFDLTGLPEHASSARVELFCYRTRGFATTSLYLDRIVQPWDWRIQGSGRDRDRLWWFDRPSGEQWRPDPLPAPTVGEWYSVDITDMYNLWQGGYPNYGLQLRPTSIGNEWSEFYSANYSDPTFRPRLVVVP